MSDILCLAAEQAYASRLRDKRSKSLFARAKCLLATPTYTRSSSPSANSPSRSPSKSPNRSPARSTFRRPASIKCPQTNPADYYSSDDEYPHDSSACELPHPDSPSATLEAPKFTSPRDALSTVAIEKDWWGAPKHAHKPPLSAAARTASNTLGVRVASSSSTSSSCTLTPSTAPCTAPTPGAHSPTTALDLQATCSAQLLWQMLPRSVLCLRETLAQQPESLEETFRSFRDFPQMPMIETTFPEFALYVETLEHDLSFAAENAAKTSEKCLERLVHRISKLRNCKFVQ